MLNYARAACHWRNINVARTYTFALAIAVALASTGCSGELDARAPFGAVTAHGSLSATGANPGKSSIAQARGPVSAIPSIITETPGSSDAFVDSVGVDTHFHFNNSVYVVDYTAVMNLLTELGVRHVRDSVATDGWPPYLNALITMAAHGIHVLATVQMNMPVTQIATFVASVPHVVEAIESPNEPDLNLGSNWVSLVRAYQPVLYSGIKSSPLTTAMPVYGPSITSPQADEACGDLSQYLDFGNMHESLGPFYPFDFNSLPGWISAAEIVSRTKPIAITETGYEDPKNVTAAVKARYMQRTLLEAWNGHISRTYFYELADSQGQNFGLIDSSGKPKPAYFAVQTLLQQLTDPGPALSPRPATYSMAADPSVHHTLLQKRDGSYRLVLWISAEATDPVVPTQAVTIKAPVKFTAITRYTWQDNGQYTAAPLAQGSDGTITLTVTDRVTVLKLQ